MTHFHATIFTHNSYASNVLSSIQNIQDLFLNKPFETIVENFKRIEKWTVYLHSRKYYIIWWKSTNIL